MVLSVSKEVVDEKVNSNEKTKALEKEVSNSKVEEEASKPKAVKSVTKTKQGKIKPQPDNAKHRIRVKENYRKNGGSDLRDYELLEMLLFYCVPRKDTKPLAKQLIADFGSFARVFEAGEHELVKYNGITENGATLINLMIDISRQYQIDKANHIDQTDTFDNNNKICDYFKNKLFGYTKEVVYVMFLDSRYKLISCEKLAEGDLTQVSFENSQIIELVIKYKAKFMAIAHTHPDGTMRPSESDVKVTADLRKALKVIKVVLLEHAIITPKVCVSMYNGGYFI